MLAEGMAANGRLTWPYLASFVTPLQRVPRYPLPH